MRRWHVLLAFAAVVVVAGCLGSPSSAPRTTTSTTTSVAPTTTTTTPATDDVFVYENLSAQSQADFRRVLSNRSVTSPTPLFGPAIAEHHYNTFYVEYHGTRYEIRHQRQHTETRVCLLQAESVEDASVGDGDVVRTYANLSNEARRLFDRVSAGNDTNTCYQPSQYPLTGYTHVEHVGDYYQLREQHASNYTYRYVLSDTTTVEGGD